MKKRIAVLLVLVLLLSLHTVSVMASSTESKFWLNNNEGTSYATLAEAVAASNVGDRIHMKGTFAYAAVQATVPTGRTLVVAGDTTVTGSSTQMGITIANGAAITCENGATLTMTSFKTALTVNAGAQVNDGKYVFKNNAGENGTKGVNLNGAAIKGSTDKNSVTVTIQDKCATNVYSPATTFENCTVSIDSNTRTWQDGYDLNLKNASLTLTGFGQGCYVNKLNMVDSEFTVNQGSSWRYATGFTIQSSANVVNSTITSNAGSTAGISIGGSQLNDSTFINSTVNVNNTGTGGLNIHKGRVTFDQSTLTSNGKQSGAAFGVQSNDSNSFVRFINGSNVETPATAEKHTGASQSGQAYIVLSGTHHVYDSKIPNKIPVNGPENGNEKLHHFQLSNTETTSLVPINSNGQVYTYPVPNASADGQKYVWVPASKVIFQLNNADAQFQDGTKADKELFAMRGYALKDALKADGKEIVVPDSPTAPGQRFLGWFHRSDDTAYDPANTKIKNDTTIYAKWESDASSYAVIYHNNLDPDVTHLVSGNAPSRKINVASFHDVVTAVPAFTAPGLEFIAWVDDTGNEVAAGSELVVPANKAKIDLHAKWKDVRVSVRFSANGGVFGANSIFKQKTNVFTIESNPAGGEVAVVKSKTVVGTKLMDLLKSLDSTFTTYTDGLYITYSNNGNIATREDYKMKPSDTGGWFGDTYSWYADPLGTTTVTIGNAVVNADTTYYLVWEPQAGIEPIPLQALPADLWSTSQNSDSTNIKPVFSNEAFSVTAGIQTSAIKDLMTQLENQLTNNGAEPDLTRIQIKNTTSSFIAKLQVPANWVLPIDLTVQDLHIEGFGDAFKVSSVTVNARELVVVMDFQSQNIANYKQLKDSINSTAAWMTMRVDGCKISNTATPNTVLTATGTVQGKFNAVAIKGTERKVYDISWTGIQIPEGKDKALDNNDYRNITYSVLPVTPATLSLYGDMLVNGDTEHNAVYEVNTGDTVAITGTVNVSAIRKQMLDIEEAYKAGNIKFEDIKVNIKNVEFTARMTLPTGMSFVGEEVKTEAFGGFVVSKKEFAGQTLTVTMKAPDGITNYQQLRDLVFGAGDTDGWMRIIVPTVKIANNATPGVPLTTTGTLTGEMTALATSPAGTVKAFAFVWDVVQWAEGKDAIATNDTSIQVSVAPVAKAVLTIPGDMLVNGDTEHVAVYETKAGASITITGALNTAAIRDQMLAIEQPYVGKIEFKDIVVDVKNVQFVADVDLPEGLSFTAGDVTLENFGDFTITEKTIAGRKAHIVMSAPTNITNYQQLHDLVFGAGDTDGWMRINIPNIKIADAAVSGSMFTVTGTVTGQMQADATSPAGTRKLYDFQWQATQWPEGKDAVATDDETIQLTVVTSGKPVNPSFKPVSVVLGGVKKAVNYRMKAEDFAFVITDASGRQQIVHNDENGNFIFAARTFSNAGTFTYTISEMQGNIKNMMYDNSVYTVKITTTATDDKLTAKTELLKNGMPYTGDILFVNTKRAPQTGDAGYATPLILMAIALLGLVIIHKKKKMQA